MNNADEHKCFAGVEDLGGVADGTRTHDDQNHNLGLYQLSYSHRSAVRHYMVAFELLKHPSRKIFDRTRAR